MYIMDYSSIYNKLVIGYIIDLDLISFTNNQLRDGQSRHTANVSAPPYLGLIGILSCMFWCHRRRI